MIYRDFSKFDPQRFNFDFYLINWKIIYSLDNLENMISFIKDSRYALFVTKGANKLLAS